MIKLINDDCTKILKDIIEQYKDRNIIIVSDPPFNINYKYNQYRDNMKEDEYFDMLS